LTILTFINLHCNVFLNF